MKLGAIAVAVVSVSSGFLATPRSQTATEITDNVVVKDVFPFGVNLGTWTSWGAEQLSANVLKNPGFEGLVDRAIVTVQVAAPGVFDDNQAWLSRPDGFWTGAHYAVLSGEHAGEEGQIASSRSQDTFGLPGFSMSGATTVLSTGDVVSLTKIDDVELPTQWWFSNSSADVSFRSELQSRRPASPGVRSLRLIARSGATAQVTSYLDAIGDRAGKLLPLEGRWRLKFWSRLDLGAGNLKVVVERDGSSPVLSANVALGAQWRETELTFTASDPGPTGIVELAFQFSGLPAGELLLDDVDLRRVDDRGSAFRGEVISSLEKLHPGYLRDWEGQLGETLANQVADSFARRSSRYRPGDASQTDYGYGLPAFLDLALRVHASPWIIVPTTFSTSECAGLGTFLNGNPEYRQFHEVVIEFGNENWNPLFRPAGIPDPIAHGQVSDACFAAVRQSGGELPLRMTINAQDADTQGAVAFAQASAKSDLISLAPYYLFQLNAAASLQSQYALLFQGDGNHFQQISAAAAALRKEAAVYEINAHTDQGTAPSSQRDPVTSGLPSASALAKTMLDALSAGGRRQCIYTLSGFDNLTTDPNNFVKLWGIVRDLGPTRRFRPTGLSLQMLNQAIHGDMVRVRTADPSLSVYAFRANERWSAVAISTSAVEKSSKLRFPEQARIPTRLLELTQDAPDATNEDGDHVTISESTITPSRQTVTIDLPPFGMAVLTPEEDAQ
jgi:hypothetical protein